MKVNYLKIVQLRKKGYSLNSISKISGHKWETVSRAIEKCIEVWGALEEIPENVTSDEIDALINEAPSSSGNYLAPDCDEILARCRRGETRVDIWNEYVEKAAKAGKDAYQISRFNEIVSKYAEKNDFVITFSKIPGQECQIDWVGDKAVIIDYDTKEKVELHLFVVVLPYSGYFYTEAFTDEKMQSWLTGHKHAFEFFGGVPTVAIPDNCATATDESRKKYYDEVISNKRYEQFMDHYGIVLAPARAYKPKDKPTVEVTVRIIEQDLMKPLKDKQIGSVAEYNRALHELLIERLAKDYTKKLGSRTSIFLEEEKDVLGPLPVMNFNTATEREATAGADFRIQYQYAFYSVPCKYARSKVIVRDENGFIKIYNKKRELIAVHKKAVHKWQRVTDPSHEPAKFDKFITMTPETLVFRASKIGTSLAAWAQDALAKTEIQSDMFRTVDSVIRFAATANKEAVEAAADKARTIRVFSVKGFKNIYNNIKNGMPGKDAEGEEANKLSFKPIYLTQEKEAANED